MPVDDNEEHITCQATCYRCLGEFTVHLVFDWSAYQLGQESLAEAETRRQALIDFVVVDFLCDSCADAEAAEYDRQYAHDWYDDRI